MTSNIISSHWLQEIGLQRYKEQHRLGSAPIVISVVLVSALHFSYGLVTVCKVRLHNSYSFG